jgi:hypothetical protein
VLFNDGSMVYNSILLKVTLKVPLIHQAVLFS